MTILGGQKKAQESSVTSSFEDVYKASYSHGLESIYKLETVDPKSIRKITEPKVELPSVVQEQLPDQLDLPFGFEFQSTMSPFVLQEPLSVLELSRHAEKCLIEQGKLTIKDLYEAEFTQLKGLGQGHIDEIKSKLKVYTAGKPLKFTRKIDFASWVKAIAGTCERKKLHVMLEAYQLQDLFPLSPADNVEVKRLTSVKRQEWVQEAKDSLLQSNGIKCAYQGMQQLIAVLVKPWMRNRHGLASRAQILERVSKMSVDPAKAEPVFKWVEDVFFNSECPLSHFLYEVDKHLFADSSCNEYGRVLEVAKSYFYKSAITYNLSELLVWMEKEFAAVWIDLPEGYIEKVLWLSHGFRIRKDLSGHLIIRNLS